jgi:phospholipid/cholesterol/gamma-HCH transport system substrate-binding protein
LKKEVKAGILVIVAIALFVFGFNFIKGRNIFHPQRTFYAVYDQIDGLVTSNPVVVNGFHLGQVQTTSLLQGTQAKVLVSFTVNHNDFKIPINSVAKIVSMDLLGSKAIEIVMGDALIYYNEGDTLLSEVQASLTEEVNRQVAPLKNKAENLISSVDSVLTIVQTLLNKEAISNIEKSFESISRTIGSLENTAHKIDTMVMQEKGKISTIIANVESISTNFRENNQKLSKIISNFESISDSIVRANIASTINNADRSLAQTNEILEKINRGEGSMGMLIHNDTLYKNLERASLDLDKLLKDIRLNPQRYLHFSIIGRRERVRQEE